MNFSTTQGMATSKKGSKQFATGIAAGNQKSLVFNKYAADVMREVAVDLFKEQAETAEVYLNERTGGLLKHLRSAPFTILQSNGQVALELEYILQIRFLDLKKTKKGKKKRNYTPIYNKLVWGFIFGNLYPQLKYGFTEQVRQRYIGAMQEIYKDPI